MNDKELFTQEELKKVLEDTKVQIQSQMVEQAKESIMTRIKWSIETSADVVVKKFFDEEIAPILIASLQTHKDTLQKCAVESAVAICKGLCNSMVTEATKNISGSYRVSEIIKKIFNP
jgi:predicted transcriptional regulator